MNIQILVKDAYDEATKSHMHTKCAGLNHLNALYIIKDKNST